MMFDDKCTHPFLKKSKCLFCGIRLSKALIEYRYKEYIEND